jgi:hypothetical protein
VAVKVAELPEQIVALLTPIVGVALTVTVAVLTSSQPFEVPVTVYVVVPDGFTFIVGVEAPVFQL